ncbi:MAG: hypothetical protein ABIO81_12420 [Ginsengibacter sp.]
MSSSKEISIVDKIFSLSDDVAQKNNESVKTQLIGYVNELINNDFNSLIQLLYRIDVNEKDLKYQLKQNENADAASEIADMIITRQLQKIATRKKFSGSDKPSPDDSW